MKRSGMYGIISLALICVMILNCAGCVPKARAADLMEGIREQDPDWTPRIPEVSYIKTVDFAVRLLRTANEEGRDTLVSPISVLSALAMTANGAEGETKAQMEETLGMNTDELNLFFKSFRHSLGQTEKEKIRLANAIWFTEDPRFTVSEDFLQTNADYYGADAYKAPFDDSTLKQINGWVKDRTDGMIPEILDKIPPNAVMYLVNALAFEAEWAEIYRKEQVREGVFTLEDGTERKTEFMHSEESAYLEDDLATGFLKYYAGGRYAFAALLPKEGVSVSDYLASLDGKRLHGLLTSPAEEKVRALIPKFESEYSTELSEVLIAMGMDLAFDDMAADFTGLGSSTGGNIFINRVIHKTFISVAEKGTKAGAATVVEMTDKAAFFENPKEVYLDRPFVYFLIDAETGVPFFAGTLMDPAE